MRRGVPIPPSLVEHLQGAAQPTSASPPPEHGNLEAWARQGVLLLNTTLTVRAGQAASHQGKGWETFTDEVLRAVATKPDPVVFILWGASARKKKALIDTSRRHVSSSPPTRRRCRAHNGFFGSRPFSRANAALAPPAAAGRLAASRLTPRQPRLLDDASRIDLDAVSTTIVAAADADA